MQVKNNRVAIPTTYNTKNPPVPELPQNISHVYTRQHDVKGLGARYAGPFPVISKPSRTTIEIKVGTNKDGSDRREIRHLSDIKIAYLREDAAVAERPKRGRPPKSKAVPSQPSSQTLTPAAAQEIDSSSTNDGIQNNNKS